MGSRLDIRATRPLTKPSWTKCAAFALRTGCLSSRRMHGSRGDAPGCAHRWAASHLACGPGTKRKTADVPLGAERCFGPVCVCFVVQVERGKANPYCDWGIPFSGFDEEQFRETLRRYSGLYPKNTERMCWFNLETLTMTLLDSVSRNRD
jgi:hypothetical protein